MTSGAQDGSHSRSKAIKASLEAPHDSININNLHHSTIIIFMSWGSASNYEVWNGAACGVVNIEI